MKLRTFLLAFLLVGCGSEVGRLPLNGEGSGTAVANLKGGEVALWTDIDLDYEGDGTLTYEVTLMQDGKQVAKTTCDPLARLPTRVKWVETNIGSKHSRSGQGKMTCTASVPAAGQTNAKVTLAWASKPQSATIRKADLVLKQ